MKKSQNKNVMKIHSGIVCVTLRVQVVTEQLEESANLPIETVSQDFLSRVCGNLREKIVDRYWDSDFQDSLGAEAREVATQRKGTGIK